eukprot:COSAG02_NODE_5289_length_4469_cov_2.041876_4_plen_209_part_00
MKLRLHLLFLSSASVGCGTTGPQGKRAESAAPVLGHLRHSVLVEAAGTAGTLGAGVAWAGLAGGQFCDADGDDAPSAPPQQLMAVGHAPPTNGSHAMTWVALFLGPTPHRVANATIAGSCDEVSMAAGTFARGGPTAAAILCSTAGEYPRVLLVRAGADCAGPLHVSERPVDLPVADSESRITAGRFTGNSPPLPNCARSLHLLLLTE